MRGCIAGEAPTSQIPAEQRDQALGDERELPLAGPYSEGIEYLDKNLREKLYIKSA